MPPHYNRRKERPPLKRPAGTAKLTESQEAQIRERLRQQELRVAEELKRLGVRCRATTK